MFLAWCLLNGMAGEIHTEDFFDTLSKLQRREITPGAFLIKACDEKFTDEDLSDEGNAFAEFYYHHPEGGFGSYLNDYDSVFGTANASLYEVEDSWSNFELLAPVIEKKYEEWKSNDGQGGLDSD